MEYKIKKGDKFLCLKDYVMDDETIAYTDGKTYISEHDDMITDDSGEKEHRMDGQSDFFEYFKPITT